MTDQNRAAYEQALNEDSKRGGYERLLRAAGAHGTRADVDLKRFTYHQAVRNLVAQAEQTTAALLILRAAAAELPEGDAVYDAEAAASLRSLSMLLPPRSGEGS